MRMKQVTYSFVVRVPEDYADSVVFSEADKLARQEGINPSACDRQIEIVDVEPPGRVASRPPDSEQPHSFWPSKWCYRCNTSAHKDQ